MSNSNNGKHENPAIILYWFDSSRVRIQKHNPQSKPTWGDITLYQNESISIAEIPLSIRVLTITDSRCPSDVVCVWAGQASVGFGIEATPFQLLIGQFKEFDIQGKHIRITLIDVTPYPTTANGGDKKSAVLAIARL